MSAAWLLARRHDVTVYEREGRPGGHCNTVVVRGQKADIRVDTGFIVYNEATYPNLVALFRHLAIPVIESDMSFAVSLRGGECEYSGGSLRGLLAQPSNLARPWFWSMLADIVRFFRTAKQDAARSETAYQTLGDYLDLHGYGSAFRECYLLPMAGAIWSATANDVLGFPAATFLRFQANHGLLEIRDRPPWFTVAGGSRVYVDRMMSPLSGRVMLTTAAASVRRTGPGIEVVDAAGGPARYDEVVLASHADEALRLLDRPSEDERRLLSAFRYSRSRAVLHSDPGFMPKRRNAWSSWNHLGETGEAPIVTYWMNRLQRLPPEPALFVTLNPPREPRGAIYETVYEHPLFDATAIEAQRRLWSLQGHRNTWYCGAYWGSGFHEDALQSGLAVAEALGGLRRPWEVPNDSGRIAVGASPQPDLERDIAA